MRAIHPGDQPKYRRVYELLRKEIESGKYAPGSRMPSEADLADQMRTSRITIARAFQELHMQGFVDRRVGAGTYVRSSEPMQELRFGLLIPDLGRTEIFEPICQGMTQVQSSSVRFSLLWGSSQGPHATSEEQAEALCKHFLDVGVSGVFFAPFEHTPERNSLNRRIVERFDQAGIPVVLLDRDLETYPARSRYDVVGIDNRRAGFMLAEHLLARGCKRIAFLSRPSSAPTVDARIMGYRDALTQSGIPSGSDWVRWLDPSDRESLAVLMRELRPEALICANDETAMRVMQTLTSLDYEIPAQVLVASFDDVKHAELLMVPLTSIRQPCAEIGAEAVAAMLERVSRPNLSARDILLDFRLIERKSTQRPQDEKKEDSAPTEREKNLALHP